MIYKSLVKKVSIPADKKTKQKEYIKSGKLPIIDQGKELIGGYTDNLAMLMQCDLPVIVFGDHTRNVKFIPFQFGAGADGIKVLRPLDCILPKYLYYGTQYLVFRLPDKGYARHYQHVEKMNLPVPPLEEQARIVARIEELFSQLESGVETLKQTKEQLAVYRLSVLKAAFEGRFTHAISDKTWRIIDFADVDTGATPLTSNPDYYNGEIAWVTSAKINDNEITTASDYITEKALKETNCKVFPPHTLLVAMYGEGKTRGKCAELMIPAATNQALAAIRIRETSEISLAYVKWFLTFNYQNIRRKAAGGVQPNLNLGIVKNIQVPQHTKEEQNRIVSEIESRLSVCDQIEQTVDAALQQAEALRQSILKKAFEGGL